MRLNDPVNAPVQELYAPLFSQKEVRVFMQRDDLIHPNISGNKWRKLKYNLLEAQAQKHNTVLTFGGAYSNHIHALACAGQVFGFKTIGIIRGEAHVPLNPTLRDAVNFGMQLHYIDRELYRQKETPAFIKQLRAQFGACYIVPEGGTNELALKGTAEIIEPKANYDAIFVPIGTAGTISGIIKSTTSKVYGVSSLKGGTFLREDILNLIKPHHGNFEVLTDYHFGGYGKLKPKQLDFIKKFRAKHNILLDPIYNSKMAFAFYDLLQKDQIPTNSKVLLIHTGGLQGWRGFVQRGIADESFLM